MTSSLPILNNATTTLHNELIELLKRYNVNEYAASVKVFAFKPR